jgi:hypothetical protein
MANDNIYVTLLIYLVVFNVIAAFVVSTIFVAVGYTSQGFDTTYKPEPTNMGDIDYNQTVSILDADQGMFLGFWGTFISGLIFIPASLWGEVYPIGMFIVTFFLIIKMGIAVCIWKIVNPFSSG